MAVSLALSYGEPPFKKAVLSGEAADLRFAFGVVGQGDG